MRSRWFFLMTWALRHSCKPTALVDRLGGQFPAVGQAAREPVPAAQP